MTRPLAASHPAAAHPPTESRDAPPDPDEWLKKSPKTTRARLALEHLETREVPATYLWTDATGSGLWGNNVNWTGALPGNETLTLGADSTLFVDAVVSDGGVVKGGNEFVYLSADNTYAGPTRVSAGALGVGGSQPRSAASVTGGVLPERVGRDDHRDRRGRLAGRGRTHLRAREVLPPKGGVPRRHVRAESGRSTRGHGGDEPQTAAASNTTLFPPGRSSSAGLERAAP